MRLSGWVYLAICVALSGAAAAQNTGTVTPAPESAATEPVAKDPPAGGCMPIGITASGEIVFPLPCREFIEQHKTSSAKPVDTTPRSEAPMPEPVKPSAKPADPAPLSKRVEREPQDRSRPPPGCTNFRSYDAASGTYFNFEGQRRRCR
jgi:hypothetical protein